MHSSFLKAFTIFLILTASSLGHSKTFKNSYLEFNLPPQWNCQLRGKAYVCRYQAAEKCAKEATSAECRKQIKKSKEALIVMTAKKKSSVDNLDYFKKHFSNVRFFTAGNSSSQSKVVHNKFVKIKNLKWLDSMHLGSEVPHYYTRYLATIKQDVAVLVSFSSHTQYYTSYTTPFFNSIKSLKIHATQINDVDKKEVGQQILSHPIDLPEILMENLPPQGSTGTNNDLSTLLFLLSLVFATTGLFIWFKKQKKNKR